MLTELQMLNIDKYAKIFYKHHLEPFGFKAFHKEAHLPQQWLGTISKEERDYFDDRVMFYVKQGTNINNAREKLTPEQRLRLNQLRQMNKLIK